MSPLGRGGVQALHDQRTDGQVHCSPPTSPGRTHPAEGAADQEHAHVDMPPASPRGFRKMDQLQHLVHRRLSSFREAISVQMRGAGVFAAPANLDVSLGADLHPWLPSLGAGQTAGRPSSGIFRTILFSEDHVVGRILTEHTSLPLHAVKLHIPPLRIHADAEHGRILHHVIVALVSTPNPSVTKRHEDRMLEETLNGSVETDVPHPQSHGSASDLRKEIWNTCCGAPAGSSTLASAWCAQRQSRWQMRRAKRLVFNLRALLRRYKQRTITQCECGLWLCLEPAKRKA